MRFSILIKGLPKSRCFSANIIKTQPIKYANHEAGIRLPYRGYSSASSSNSSELSFLERVKRFVGWNPTPKGFIVGFGLLSLLAGLYWHSEKTKRLRRLAVRTEQAKRTLGGGEFTLVDVNGKEVNQNVLSGSWCLVYFGFTHCPDICPDELEKISLVVKMLRENPTYPKLRAVFISVDPRRDTPEAVKKYLKDFPDIEGYTGTPEQIKHVCKQFHLYSEPHAANESGDYIVDHTIITYLINPEYAFVDYYMRTNTADEIVRSFLHHVKDYLELQKFMQGILGFMYNTKATNNPVAKKE